jgi:hypothetical protein
MGKRGTAFATLVVLTALIGLPAIAGTPEEGGRFWDDDGTTHEPNIEAIAAIEVTLGCVQEGTAYCPDLSVTRAQMASFLARAFELTEVGGSPFTDVTATNVHIGNINAIRNAGITLGCSADGTKFCPNEFVSRAQMGSFLARALGLSPIASGGFQDLTGWDAHAGNINAIAADGITLGCTADGRFYCPANLVTRGQMASFLARALDLSAVAVAPRLDLSDFMTCDVDDCAGSGNYPADSPFFIRHGFEIGEDDPDYEAIGADPNTGFVLFLDGDELPSTTITSTFRDGIARWDVIDFRVGLTGVHEFEAQWLKLGAVVQVAIIEIDFG